MATNYVQAGDTLTIPAGADYLSGDVVIENEIIGVALGDAVTGNPVDVRTTGVFDVPKVGANAFAVGDPVYFDSDTSLATSTATDNTKIGVAVAAAAASTATVNVRLSGF
ncbi:DUF2190 family protein [Martelella radicis]|uniref:Putative RecA/RadA family phage recombinase n=1 Tax=Martelella radicis TaxID=1397476 RepID=A0A7W6KFL4_9HYPH|nr:DUF2190 family protein [Martelella radicis]MBB4120208.1 putative RecA/RadA family phage recombinase [Martelella radicis]